MKNNIDSPIRIAHIVGKWVGGGVEAVVMNYYRHIDRNKIQFDFLCDDDSTNIPYDEIEKLGGRVILVPPYQKVFKYHKELKRIFKENKYKIVHSHINTLSVFPLFAAKCAGVKVRIAHSHSTIINDKREFMRNILKNILKHFSRLFSTDYFACSEEAAISQFGRKAFLLNKIVIINNAIDTKKFLFNIDLRKKIRLQYDIPMDAVVFGTVGRLVITKNPIFSLKRFIDYYYCNSNSYLVFVGQGPLKENILKLIKDKPYEKNIIFVGQVSNVSDYYNIMDLFMFPSLYEGFGMALIEAQYNGLPCVCSSSIPMKTKICSNVNYVSLDLINEWNKVIMSIIKSYSLDDRKKFFLIHDDFNISMQVKKLEYLYLSKGGVDDCVKKNKKN